jgi:hypothetical protein
MKIIFAFLLSCVGMAAIAQDSWKVCLDKKILLSTSIEDAEKNVIKLFFSDLKKRKIFTVNYNEVTHQKGWERTITAYDEKDNELKKQTGKKFSLKTSELKILLDKYKTVKIYTINFPTDPKMKSQVRLRRVHLCTLALQ